MYSSCSAATFALRASKPSLHAHSSYSYSYAYLPSHHCHFDDDAAGGHRHEPLPQKPYLSPRFLLDGYLLRHSPHFLLLSARLRPRPPPPPHPHPPRCCPRRASARHCDPGSEGPSHGRVSCRAEPCGCWCSWRCFARSDLGPACRRLEARGCCCSGSSNGRSLGTGCQGRDASRLMRRAVQREVWEYDGEWPHRRCSTECYDDWEEEDEECVHHPRQRLNCGKWDDDGDYNVDVGDHGCRDCGQRKGLETYYDGGDRYSGRRRERRDMDGYHDSFRDTDRRRQLQRHYHDDEDDLDLRRRRQSWRRRDRRDLDFNDTVDTRTVRSRRYDDNDRRYDHRRERRDLDHNDAVDVRRAGSYAEDVRRINRSTDSRDFEIDDEDDLRREGSRHGHVDKRNVIRSQRREYDGDDNSLLQSCHRRNEEFEYDDQDHTERRYYSEGRSQKSLRASDLHEDDAKRASSSRSTADARQENSSSSRVRWRDNVDRWTSDTRDQRYSFGCSSNQREEHDYDEAQYATVRDARTGTQDVKVITEDDSRLASSSNNKTILKHSSNVDQKETVLNDELRKSSHNIMEISEVRGNRIDQDMRAHGYHQEDRTNVENRSSSLQSSVEIASDSRGQIDQRSVVNQQLASQTESTNNKVKFTAVTTDSDRNASSASHRQRNYDEVNQTDIDERSASLQNITHVTRDKERIVNQQVIHETDIDVQNVTHVDVTKIHASDISMSMNSQKHSQTESDVNVTSSMNLIGSANNNALVRAPESKLEAGMSDWFHSTSSTNISDNTKESNDPVELSMAHTDTASVASTSESHLQRTADDQFQLTSALTTIDSVNKQCDLAKIHATDGSVVTSSQGFDTRNGNRIPGTSAVNLLGEHQGMSSQQSIQVSIMQRNDEQRTKSYESSQVSREKLVRLEDTERLMQHNMDLIWQEEGASGISNDKDVTRLQIDSTEDGSSMVNKDIARSAMITGRNEQDLRSEGTAGRSIASGSSARQSVKESMLESAARLEKSSTFHVGQFVDELQKGISNTDMGPTKKNEKSMVDGTTTSSSWSRLKGPADEMWDVQSTTSQETFRTADREEGYSADRATDSASQTPKNESALATKVHKSLWAYVADIIRLGWIQRGDSHDSSVKSVKKSSSSNSQSTQGWISSQEHDIDSIRKKYESTKVKDQQLIKSHGVEPESRAVSLPMEENLHAEKQVLQKPEAGIVPQVNRSEGDLLAVSLRADQNISVEGLKQSTVGESPKGSKIEGSTPSSVDVSIGHSLDPEVATSSRITAKGSVENTGKGYSSSMTISSTEPAYIGTGADWIYDPSGAIIPYHHPQMQAVMPHDSTSAEMLESPALPVGGSMRFEEKNVVQETPEVIKTEGKDAELKRKMFQRNKQVLKETFDEWEEAYQRDAELRKADELFMREALLEAQKAADIWEVPVGAVLVQNGEIIARGCNLVEDLRDSTAHAEIVCIREASNKLKTWRLADTTLYVTLEPCAMCAGAILQARIDTLVWGAPNKLLGADGSWVRLFPGDGQTSTLDSANQSQTTGPIHPFHPKITIRRGVLSSECSEIMQQFFQLRRRKNQKPQSPPRAHQQGHHHPLKFFSKMRFASTFCL